MPALRTLGHHAWLRKFEIFPTNDGTSGKFSRAVAMPYGATWNVLPEQNALSSGGKAMLLDHFLAQSRKLPLMIYPNREELQQQSRKIPLYLQAAINAFVPEKDRSNYCWSMLLHLVGLGFDRIQICNAVRGKGPLLDTTRSPAALRQTSTAP